MKDYLNNASRYPRFFVTILLGVMWNFIEPLLPLLKRPTTAIALAACVVAGFTFLSFTLRAMLGLSPI